MNIMHKKYLSRNNARPNIKQFIVMKSGTPSVRPKSLKSERNVYENVMKTFCDYIMKNIII